MPINPDFRDLFAELNAAEARFLVVGAYAVTFHSEPRYTKDLDLWVDPTGDNPARVLQALSAFGAPTSQVTVDDLATPGLVYQIGIEPNRVDILTGISGVGDFGPAWDSASMTTYGKEPVRVLGLDDLIRSKEAAGRPQDRLDVHRLLEVKRRGR